MLIVQSYGSQMLHVCPGRSLGGPLSQHGVLTAPVMAHHKTKAECHFCFSPFFVKAKIPFGFLLVSEKRSYCRSFLKTKCPNMNFHKAGAICIWLIYDRGAKYPT